MHEDPIDPMSEPLKERWWEIKSSDFHWEFKKTKMLDKQ